jgi:hypothetical protein
MRHREEPRSRAGGRDDLVGLHETPSEAPSSFSGSASGSGP